MDDDVHSISPPSWSHDHAKPAGTTKEEIYLEKWVSALSVEHDESPKPQHERQTVGKTDP